MILRTEVVVWIGEQKAYYNKVLTGYSTASIIITTIYHNAGV